MNLKKYFKIAAFVLVVAMLMGSVIAFAGNLSVKNSIVNKMGLMKRFKYQTVAGSTYNNLCDPKTYLNIKNLIDMDALVAQALGMTKDEYIKARNSGKTLSTLLSEKNLTTDAFNTKLKAAYTAYIDSLVTQGKITKEQADVLKQKFPFMKGLFREKVFDSVYGHAYRPMDKGFSLKIVVGLDTHTLIAQTLGITDNDLRVALQSGKTLSDLIKEKNMTVDTFKTKFKKLAEDLIDNMLAKGTITKEQANILKTNLNNFLTNFDPTKIGMGHGYKGMMKRGMHKGMPFGNGTNNIENNNSTNNSNTNTNSSISF